MDEKEISEILYCRMCLSKRKSENPSIDDSNQLFIDKTDPAAIALYTLYTSDTHTIGGSSVVLKGAVRLFLIDSVIYAHGWMH